MTDETLIGILRIADEPSILYAADRIEALLKERDSYKAEALDNHRLWLNEHHLRQQERIAAEAHLHACEQELVILHNTCGQYEEDLHRTDATLAAIRALALAWNTENSRHEQAHGQRSLTRERCAADLLALLDGAPT